MLHYHQSEIIYFLKMPPGCFLQLFYTFCKGKTFYIFNETLREEAFNVKMN